MSRQRLLQQTPTANRQTNSAPAEGDRLMSRQRLLPQSPASNMQTNFVPAGTRSSYADTFCSKKIRRAYEQTISFLKNPMYLMYRNILLKTLTLALRRKALYNAFTKQHDRFFNVSISLRRCICHLRFLLSETDPLLQSQCLPNNFPAERMQTQLSDTGIRFQPVSRTFVRRTDIFIDKLAH